MDDESVATAATAGEEEDLAGCVRSLAQSVAALATAVRSDSPSELLTAEELGERFRMPPRTIKEYASTGRLPHHRLGKHLRFNKDDVADILRLTRQEPVRHRSARARAVWAA